MEQKKELVTVNANKISGMLDNFYSPEQLLIIKNQVLKGSTDMELAHFASVCQTSGLNPFMNEIWGYKDNKGNLIIFAGRDGMLKRAQENEKFNGIRSFEVRANDMFNVDIANNEIKHKIKTMDTKKRGEIIGACAIVFRKDGEPTIETADFQRYNKGYNVWKSHPEAMIKKVAETYALKKAFGISGVQIEYDFDVKDNVATPISIDEIRDTKEVAIAQIEEINNLDELDLKLGEWAHLLGDTEFENIYRKRYNELEGIETAD